ncbi:MAG: hypothetical protein ACR2JW_01745 [Thermomicrobiales bacterium]
MSRSMQQAALPPTVSTFPTDTRDPDAPHRRLLAPLADMLGVATEAARAAHDTLTEERLDQAWLLIVAAVVDTQAGSA